MCLSPIASATVGGRPHALPMPLSGPDVPSAYCPVDALAYLHVQLCRARRPPKKLYYFGTQPIWWRQLHKSGPVESAFVYNGIAKPLSPIGCVSKPVQLLEFAIKGERDQCLPTPIAWQHPPNGPSVCEKIPLTWWIHIGPVNFYLSPITKVFSNHSSSFNRHNRNGLPAIVKGQVLFTGI